MSRSIPRPSAALVVACLALFVALADAGGGAILQVIPPLSVGTAQLKNGAVTSSKVKDHTLRPVDFAAGALPSGISGYEVVSAQNTVGAGFLHNSVLLTCPPGKKVIGGGGATGGGIVPGDGPYLTSDLPSTDGTGWLIDTTRAQPGGSTLEGRIICAKVP